MLLSFWSRFNLLIDNFFAWKRSFKGLLAVGQTGSPLIVIKPVAKDNDHSNNNQVHLPKDDNHGGLRRVIKSLQSGLYLEPQDVDDSVTIFSNHPVYRESVITLPVNNQQQQQKTVLSPLRGLIGSPLQQQSIPVPVSFNLIISRDLQTPSSISSQLNLTSMEVSKKVTRSVSDDCPSSIVRDNPEKQVTKSVKIDGRYKNPWETWNENSFRITSLMRFSMARDNSAIPNQKELDKVLPIQKPEFSEESPSDGVRITWIGHSTLIAQFDGFTVMTDPIFSSRASPSQYFGPRRYRDPACSINDLPKSLDAVVISHNHYDHLDVNSINKLNERYGTSLSWYVPMGLKSWFNSLGIKHAIEMDWWDETCYNKSITIAFTPAQHWSKRGITDDFSTLWGSWTFIGPSQRFFFTGDTGYCPVFKEIGQVYGPFTVAAIPIGAYEPRWFMKAQHVDPEEAVLIHQDLRAKSSVAIHWGTFALAFEFFLDPPLKLASTLEKLNLSNSEFIAMKHGESKVFPLGPKEADESVNQFQQSVIANLQESPTNSFLNSTYLNSFLNYVNNFIS